ncbi:chorismate synthase [Patescibacteria group bacterium]
MPGNSFGQFFKVTTWGESHGKALGVIIDGCPPGLPLDEKNFAIEVERRKPRGRAGTSRREADRPEILSGVFEGKTTGTPLSIVIWNKNVKSKDYSELKDVYRPGHADYTYEKKYGMRDYRGGGRSSGRETVTRVIAGAIAKKILTKHRTRIESEVLLMGEAPRGDSSGGIVEITVKNPPTGLGEPVFSKLDADLCKAIVSIGAVKGVEIGAGFEVAEMFGSENNDEYTMKGNRVRTRTNNAGGILGGISNGEDIVVRFAVKPPASIEKKQKTVTMRGRAREISVKGRHDSNITPRILPVAESMVAITLVDHLLRQKAYERV